MSFSQVLRGISSTLGTSVGGARVHPANHAESDLGKEFLIFQVFPASSRNEMFVEPVYRGFAEVSVYTPAGGGAVRAAELCDLLEGLLSRKILGNGIQTSQSRIEVAGIDLADTNLYRVNFLIDWLLAGPS